MPDRELAVLSRVPLFAPPPAVALEHVACSLRSVRAAPGERVVTQGDPGDRFYVILS